MRYSSTHQILHESIQLLLSLREELYYTQILHPIVEMFICTFGNILNDVFLDVLTGHGSLHN